MTKPTQDTQDWFSAKYLDVALKLERNATIERCAQAAEESMVAADQWRAAGKLIAARIRALKDKP